MEYVIFILLILFLGFLLILIAGIDRRTKNKWRKTAYGLLENEHPDRKEIVKAIKNLRLYGGRIRRDKEFKQLITRLHDRLDSIEK